MKRCYNNRAQAVFVLLPYNRRNLGLDDPKPREIHRHRMQIMQPTISAQKDQLSEIKNTAHFTYIHVGCLFFKEN